VAGECDRLRMRRGGLAAPTCRRTTVLVRSQTTTTRIPPKWANAPPVAVPEAAEVMRYNTSWLIERHGHNTPREAYLGARKAAAA
jgi:hypothetical protein